MESLVITRIGYAGVASCSLNAVDAGCFELAQWLTGSCSWPLVGFEETILEISQKPVSGPREEALRTP